jgi:hypothetical protein
MRSSLRLAGGLLLLVALFLPVAGYAGGGACPDDLVAAQNCAQQAPPYYVVVNRDFERLGPQYGTGCQPWILEHPDCTDCSSGSQACLAAAIDVEQIICGYEMPNAGAQAGDVLFEMCCNCGAGANGAWMYRQRTLQHNATTNAWECPDYGEWQSGLPPRTGIDLPAPLVVGGLGVVGAGLLAVGLVMRRRTVRAA